MGKYVMLLLGLRKTAVWCTYVQYIQEKTSLGLCVVFATRYYTTALIDIGSGVVDEDYRGPVKITTYYHYLY